MSETCAICGAPKATAEELVEHMNTAHKNEDPASDVEMNPETHTPGYVCALCGHRFPTPAALARHNLQPHPPPEVRRSEPSTA
ncbi:MAG TPA: C2H2-type zinc finger protein [Acidimicrobiales bacterium]|jgi:Zinc finger, C2H2 type|nr:C2H2-type zinc finger protein [Acidimicrobiales bacterium]